MNWGNLQKRLLFVVWAVPLAWWVINSRISVFPSSFAPHVHVYPGQILGIMLSFLAFYEYIRMLSIIYPRNAFWLCYFWLTLEYFLYLTNNPLPSNLGLYVLLMIVAAETFVWGKRNQRKRWARASLLFSGTAFLYITSRSLLDFYQMPFSLLFPSVNKFFSQPGIVIVLMAVFLNDTMAYFVGSLWGKHHFSSISPGKTAEGSIAGLVTAVLITSVGWFLFASRAYPRELGIILGLLIGVFGQLGDLLESLMKRYFKVKDSSDIIPGHGGILDRFDSLFFTGPVIYLFAWCIKKFFG